MTTRTILFAAALAAACAHPAAVLSAQGDAKKGEAVYAAQKCSMCHSIAGKGNKLSPLEGVGTKLTADQIREWIVTPTEMAAKAKSTKKPPMPAKYGKLPKEEIDALVAYMQSLK